MYMSDYVLSTEKSRTQNSHPLGSIPLTFLPFKPKLSALIAVDLYVNGVNQPYRPFWFGYPGQRVAALFE